MGGRDVILIPMFTYRSADQASKSKEKVKQIKGEGGCEPSEKNSPQSLNLVCSESHPNIPVGIYMAKVRQPSGNLFLYWLHIYVTFNICSMCFRSLEMKFQLLL